MLYIHMEEYDVCTLLIHGEQIELSSDFMASFSRELWTTIEMPVIFIFVCIVAV